MTNPTTAENKQIVRSLFEEAFNRDQPALVERLVAADYVDAAGERGPGAFKQVMTRLRGAFPDLSYTVDELIAEGDQVAVRWHWTGTHDGPFRGLSPTHQAVTNTGAAIFRLRGGQVVSASLETDRLGFLQSIGVVPATDALFRAPAARSPAA